MVKNRQKPRRGNIRQFYWKVTDDYLVFLATVGGKVRKRPFSKQKRNRKGNKTIKTQEQLDEEMMLYQAEKDGKDLEQVKQELKKVRKEREREKLDSEM
eukprot:ctg_286.g158